MKKEKIEHTKYFNSLNKEVPSVTTILKILNKPALVYWANYLGYKRVSVDDELYRTSSFGTKIHELIEHAIQGKRIVYYHELPDYSMYEVLSALNNFYKWYNKVEAEAVFQEKKFTSDNYGGTLDYYGIIDDKKTIVDFKTSKDIYPTMFVQLGLYIHLLELNGHEVERAGIVLANIKVAKHKFLTREQMEPYIQFGLKLVDIYNINESIERLPEWRKY